MQNHADRQRNLQYLQGWFKTTDRVRVEIYNAELDPNPTSYRSTQIAGSGGNHLKIFNIYVDNQAPKNPILSQQITPKIFLELRRQRVVWLQESKCLYTGYQGNEIVDDITKKVKKSV